MWPYVRLGLLYPKIIRKRKDDRFHPLPSLVEDDEINDGIIYPGKGLKNK